MDNIFDYCIVGTGIGGGILAYELSKRRKTKILVIEAGSRHGDSNNVTFESVGLQLGLRATTSIQLGGTSNLWHGVLSFLDTIDFQKRDWIPNSGWPLDFDELEPYYKDVARIFRVGRYDNFFLDRLPSNLKSKLQEMRFNRNILANKIFQQPIPPLRVKSFFRSSDKNNHIHIMLNTTALELVRNEDGSEIESLIVGMPNGKTTKVHASMFILSAGALETPRILLNSGFENKNIGKYLMDHPMGNLCQIEFKNTQYAHIYSDMKYNSKNKIKSGLTFIDEIQKKFELPNHNFYMRPSFKKGINNESEKIKLALLTFLSGRINLKDIFKLITNLNVLLQIFAYKFTLNVRYKYADLFFVTEQIPNKDSNVSLSNKKDSWGYPIAKVNWELTKLDFDSMRKTYDLLMSRAFSNTNYKFTHKKDDLQWDETFTSAAHHVGTARMSQNKIDGVVDKNLKVFDTENLYVCDGSFFTTSGNVNSGLTIGAFACRLAKHLKLARA